MENKRIFLREFGIHTSVNILQVVHQVVYTGLPLSYTARKVCLIFGDAHLFSLVVVLVILVVSTLCGNHVNFTFAMFVVVYFPCCWTIFARYTRKNSSGNKPAGGGGGGSRGRVESTICQPSPSLGAIDSHIIGSKKYTNK